MKNIYVSEKQFLRKNQMKLRKSQMISPKNFFFPPEEMNNSPVEILKYPRSYRSEVRRHQYMRQL